MHDPYAALRLPAYRRYFVGSFIATVGLQMQTTAVGWDIYLRTESKLALGFAGLAQFLPVVTLFLVSGHAADRYSRKWIVIISQLVVAIASACLGLIALNVADYRLIFVCLISVGIARAFLQPAKAALLPLLVPKETFSNAVTWNSTGFHLASVIGPALGGLMIKWTKSPTWVYWFDAIAASIFAIAILSLQVVRGAATKKGINRADLVAGFKFVRSHQVILGALSLDMFAVLLGGAVTLLPVYAEDILHVGASGLGWLRTAPAIGALTMAILLAHRPPIGKAGWMLLISVAGFGAATIGFGFSKSFWLSMLMLFMTGAWDNISVVIRHTLVQTLTPDALRGRVSAVNSLFIGASNELGGFESGLVAHFFGPVASVVSGGIGTIFVVITTAVSLPRLRKYGKLGDDDPN